MVKGTRRLNIVSCAADKASPFPGSSRALRVGNIEPNPCELGDRNGLVGAPSAPSLTVWKRRESCRLYSRELRARYGLEPHGSGP